MYSYHYLQGVLYIVDAVDCFGESATVEAPESHLLAACIKWWESMLEAAMLFYPEEMCAAMNDLSVPEGGEQLLRSRISSGLSKEVGM